MSKILADASHKANLLGDARAEADKSMLDVAFYETGDYRTLIESADRAVVVGRRGTGKSALVYMLKKHWAADPQAKAISLSPDEDQVIGLRAITKYFGDDFRILRAGARVGWKYALLMEALSSLYQDYKARRIDLPASIHARLKEWTGNRYGVADRLRDVLKAHIDKDNDYESRVGDLARTLEIRELEGIVSRLITESKKRAYILVDKLDEGYQPDDVGVAIIDGIVQAALDLNSRYPELRILIFLRDNIYRALAKQDPDFSRNIEGQTLRLHWDEHSLFGLVTNRLRRVFSIEHEGSLKVWNECVDLGLIGKDGFRKCLRMTLYRPRDLLILLNEAFYQARKKSSKKIVDEDVEYTAKQISSNRLDDLQKEYEAIIPGISLFIESFSGGAPAFIASEVSEKFVNIMQSDAFDVRVKQQFAIFPDYIDVLKNLYSIGFLGIKDDAAETFTFCHDGRGPSRGISEDASLLIHPCYWIGLSLTRNSLNSDEAEEIYDEYDIHISSDNPEQRNKKIGQLAAAINDISEGSDGWADYENWCFDVLRIVFAGSLTNFDKKPNGAALQRRDVVATNLCKTSAWERIYNDYKVRQVIFEIKNYREIGADEYRQMNSYLCDGYGFLGFIIVRGSENNLKKGGDLDWAKEMFSKHKKVIIKISAKFLVDLLFKIRSPQKHDAPDKAINALLDQYERTYFSAR